MTHDDQPPGPQRRGFLKQLCATAAGAVLGLVPFAAGLTVFFDPLRRHSAAGRAVRVASLDALPADGVPRRFPVIEARVDAWNKIPAVPVGAVYLRRRAGSQVEALSAICPHAGCMVNFIPALGRFQCPCHNSIFTPEGRIADPASPAPRGLDALEVSLRAGNEIYVNYQRFAAGVAERIPVA